MGKGKSSSSETKINADLAKAAKPLLERAGVLGKIPYLPNQGMQFAAFTPMQQQAMQMGQDTASAFGMAPKGVDVMAGLPKAENINGIKGYSTKPWYDDIKAKSVTPNMQKYLDSLFVGANPDIQGDGELTSTYDIRTKATQDALDHKKRMEEMEAARIKELGHHGGK